MNVLFLTSSYPTSERPIDAIFVREHARAATRHAEVVVVHLDRIDDAPIVPTLQRRMDAGLPTWHVSYRRKPERLSYAANLAAALRAYIHVRRSGFDPDVIHAHFFLAGIPAVVLGRFFRKPVVLTEHWTVFLPQDPLRLGRAMTRAARFAFEGADVVLPVSESLREGIVATTGAKARFVVVPNAVDEELFSLGSHDDRANGAVKIVGVGDFYEQKGWDVFLDAVADLRRRSRRALAIEIIGQGPSEEAYRRQAATLDLGDVVTFVGPRPKEDIAAVMRTADLFVLPSRFENSPCVLGEAFSAGVPVVATAVGGVPELVERSNGLLARPEDPIDLADQLEHALDDLGGFDRRAISEAAHARFGLDAIGRTLADVYDSVTAKR